MPISAPKYSSPWFSLQTEEAPDGYVTIDYNSTPIENGMPQPGGQSDEIDFRNLNLNTVVQVDVNDFLGDGVDQVPDTDTDFQNLSITISAHELGHTLGLRHEDAIWPDRVRHLESTWTG